MSPSSLFSCPNNALSMDESVESSTRGYRELQDDWEISFNVVWFHPHSPTVQSSDYQSKMEIEFIYISNHPSTIDNNVDLIETWVMLCCDRTFQHNLNTIQLSIFALTWQQQSGEWMGRKIEIYTVWRLTTLSSSSFNWTTEFLSRVD